MLPLITFYIAHLCNQFNCVFALLISKPRFLKAIIVIKIGLKLSYFWKKKFFRSLGAPLSDPQTAPPLQISGYMPVPK